MAVCYRRLNNAPPFTPSQGGNAVLSFHSTNRGAAGNGFIPNCSLVAAALSGDADVNSEEKNSSNGLGLAIRAYAWRLIQTDNLSFVLERHESVDSCI